MNIKQTIAAILCASLFSGCASLQDIQKTLGSPAAVQSELTILVALAKPRIPESAQVKIHDFALKLQTAANLDLEPLFALIPPTGSQNADSLIAAAKAYLVATVQKYGANNQMSIAYAHAVANALLTI